MTTRAPKYAAVAGLSAAALAAVAIAMVAHRQRRKVPIPADQETVGDLSAGALADVAIMAVVRHREHRDGPPPEDVPALLELESRIRDSLSDPRSRIASVIDRLVPEGVHHVADFHLAHFLLLRLKALREKKLGPGAEDDLERLLGDFSAEADKDLV